MKKGSKEQIKSKPKISSPTKIYTFPNISNENCIKIAIKLLGVTDQTFEKETKCNIRNQLFPKNTIANSSKTFFFICQLCVKYLCKQEEAGQLMMWYPPRTANEQIQFKKAFFKIVQRLESQGVLPKNIVLSKASIAGDPTSDAVTQFLRVLTEMALRAVYLQKYSKEERLIQIALGDGLEGDINSFYPFPFCQSATNVQPPLRGEQVEAAKKIFKLHIEHYRQKILSLRAQWQGQAINPQSLMSRLMEQRQIASTLSNKVSNALFSQNRAFDRRVIIDKHRQLWKEINSLSCPYAQPNASSVLRFEGDIAKMLSGWRTATGTHVVAEFNSKSEKVKQLKSKCEKTIEEFKAIKIKLLEAMK